MVLDLLKQQLQREYRELGAKGKNPESHPEAYEEIKKRYLTILGELFGEENAQKHFDKLLTPE